jgi:RNA polymerase sigma-70 factor, ECF subfamily
MFSGSRKLVRSAIVGLARDTVDTALPALDTLERHFVDHYEPLFRFLRSCGAPAATAEDLAQEAFLRLHRHLAESRPAENVRAWLFRVGYRLWIDHWRERRRETLAEDIAWDLWQQVLADPAPAADQELLARERRDWLRAAILRLSELQRKALYLRADGLHYREIAEVLRVGYWPVVEAVRRSLEILGEDAHGL